MVKKIICAILILLCLFPVLAISYNMHLGITSGFGIEKTHDNYKFRLDFESSFPGFALGNGLICKNDDDSNFKEGFKSGALYFIGIDSSTHYMLFKSNPLSVFAGLSLFSGMEIPVKTFDSVLKASLAFYSKIGKRCSVYIDVNYPILALMYVPGFEKPLLYFPDFNWMSVLTGWKLGISVPIQ